MLNSDLLADRLNAHKNNEPIPQNSRHISEGNTEYYSEQIPLIISLLSTFINFGLLFLKSLAYGFAVKTIFATDWNFFAFIAVGFSIELILSTILNPFTKNK